MKIFNLNFDRTFFKQYILACIATSFGAFFIYSKQHTKATFNMNEFILFLPFVWLLVLILALGIILFLSLKEK
jgi:hypothetical protein